MEKIQKSERKGKRLEREREKKEEEKEGQKQMRQRKKQRNLFQNERLILKSNKIEIPVQEKTRINHFSICQNEKQKNLLFSKKHD